MIKIDGYATVVTDNAGKIVSVDSYYTDIENMYVFINCCELESIINSINSKDSLVLLLLKYSEFNDDKGDTIEQQISTIGEFVLKDNYQKYMEESIEELYEKYEKNKQHTTERLKYKYRPYVEYLEAVEEFEKIYGIEYPMK
ncbi:hypothetical protein [Paenibacillus elgii]|uniref:hypothetical protein n=1 Tax=Paenibacillus elgii TaxID=189691 RepID=UPI000248D22B|nr:hypothetical protein [Paenibacillus elgii]